MSGHNVVLNWAPPEFGQIRRYDVWRAVGKFTTVADVVKNNALFTNISNGKLIGNGAPPLTTFTDANVKNNTTYTYFVTDMNKQGAQSGASVPKIIVVKF